MRRLFIKPWDRSGEAEGKEECAGNWWKRERRGRLGNRVKCLRGVVEQHKEVIALTGHGGGIQTYKGGLGRV
jgi:hypothetical protein